jgi:hypothetical protein
MRYRADQSGVTNAPRDDRDTAADNTGRKDAGTGDGATMSMDGIQVVNRHCTICEWEAQLVERGLGEDPLCPWCYGPTERTSVVGLVVPEALRPGQKNPYAASLGRLGGLKGGPARAAKLTAKQRRDIASKAAKARWAGKKTKSGKEPKHVRSKEAKSGKRRGS